VTMPTTTATTPAASVPVSTPTRVAKVTAACPLLSSDELRERRGLTRAFPLSGLPIC
jgi:hypothetical protein